MTRCLLVDDDSEIRVSLADYLQRFGMSVLGVGDGAGMRRAIASERFDVIVLDLMHRQRPPSPPAARSAWT